MRVSLLAIAAALGSFAFDASAAPSNPAPVMMERMTTTEVRDSIKGGKTTVLIFNASTEATGPAVALGKHIVGPNTSVNASLESSAMPSLRPSCHLPQPPTRAASRGR